MEQKTKKNKNGLILLVSFLALVLCVLMILGISSSWGSVKITRVVFPCEGGYTASGLMYIPKTASEENPLPGALVLHGGNDNAQTFNSYSLELARRGYVVLNLDENGVCYSDFAKDFDNYELSLEAALWMKSMKFIDPNKIVATGHSMGGLYSPYATTYGELAGCIPVDSNRQEHELAGNYAFVFGKGDQLNRYDVESEVNTKFFQNAFGTDTMPEAGKEYGSIADNNYRVFVWHSGNGIHTAGTWNSSVVENVCHYALKFAPTGTALADNNLVYKWTYLFGLLGMASLMAFAVSLMLALMELPAFQSVKRPLGPYMGSTGKAWFASAALTMLPAIPLLILSYNLIGSKIRGGNVLLPSGTFNKFFPFLVIMGIWDTLTFILLFHRKKKAEGIGTAYNYGFSWEGDKKSNLINIGKCVGLSAIVSSVVLLILDFMDRNLGVGFKFYFAGMRAATLPRIGKSFGYIILALFVYLGAQFGSNIVRRLKSTGNDTRDMIRDIVVNAAVAGSMLTLLFIFQMICQNNGVFIKLIDGPAIYQFYGFSVLIVLTQGINTVLYRKSGSIWPGLTFLSILFGILLNANYPITF